jgi:hypothetical protein
MISLKEESFLENDIIDPFWIIRYLESHLPREKINSEVVIHILKKMLRRVKGVKVTFQKVKSAQDCFVINGYYDKDEKKSIEIELCSSAFKKKLTLTKKEYRSFLYEVADTLCHESLHRYQYQYKDSYNESFGKGTEAQIYFGDQDEMFCYSANIAHNIYRQYGTQSLDKLQSLKPLLKFDPYLSEYYTLFYNQPEFKKVMKMVYLHLVAMEQGKILHRPI